LKNKQKITKDNLKEQIIGFVQEPHQGIL